MRTSRNSESDRYGGVICSSSMEVPEMPLSYSFTGVRKIVMPKAFIIPATVSIAIWIILSLMEWFIGGLKAPFTKTVLPRGAAGEWDQSEQL